MESQQSEKEWVVRTVDLGNGHAEAVISRPMEWVEIDPHIADNLAWNWERSQAREAADPQEQEEREERNRKRAARRATTMVRRKVKVIGANALFTLTYRGNQRDLSLCKKHFKEFVRRLRALRDRLGRAVFPDFQYVAAFEPQARGAQHVHIATHRLPMSIWQKGVKLKSYNVMRAIWRSVTGEWGGTFNDAKCKQHSKKSPAKLAAYLSKYMMKAFADGDKWSNRYSSSDDIKVPRPMATHFRDESLADLIGVCFSAVAVGDRTCTMWLSPFKDVFYLSTEGPPH